MTVNSRNTGYKFSNITYVQVEFVMRQATALTSYGAVILRQLVKQGGRNKLELFHIKQTLSFLPYV